MKPFLIVALLLPSLTFAQSGVTRYECEHSRTEAVQAKCDKVFSEYDRIEEATAAAAEMHTKNRKVACFTDWDEQ